MLSTATRERARARSLQIAEELAAHPNTTWRGIGGCAGDALLHRSAFHATKNETFESAMHASLQRAARLPDDELGLYTGVAGLRAAARLAMDVEPRYARLVAQCDERLRAVYPQEPVLPKRFYDFDVIAGWAGMRLAEAADGAAERNQLTRSLLWLVEDWDRWKCPHPEDTDAIPVHDMGLAHGIAGILATLALTLEAPTERERDAVLRCARRVLESARGGAPFSRWPHSLENEELVEYRSAWCYGTCGVASALHLTGLAFGDADLSAQALVILRGCAQAGIAAWRVSEIGICHGVIGNALCFASAAGGIDIEPFVAYALDELDASDGRCWSQKGGERYAATDELMGTAGIALALLTLSGDAPSDWMQLHGLRPL